jgi:hypothetical protein
MQDVASTLETSSTWVPLGPPVNYWASLSEAQLVSAAVGLTSDRTTKDTSKNLSLVLS